MDKSFYNTLRFVLDQTIDTYNNKLEVIQDEFQETDENGNKIESEMERCLSEKTTSIYLSVNDRNFARLISHEDMGHNVFTAYTDLYEQNDLFDFCRAVESCTGQRLLMEKFPYEPEGEQKLYDIERRLSYENKTVRNNIFEKTGQLLNVFPDIDRANLVYDGYNAYTHTGNTNINYPFRCDYVTAGKPDFFYYGVKEITENNISFRILEKGFKEPQEITVSKEEIKPFEYLSMYLCAYAKTENVKSKKQVERA